MKKLTCETCGGADLLKQEGVFVCQSCGVKYSVEEEKKMMIEGTVEVAGTVKVDNKANLESMMKRGWLALEDSKWEQADEYFDKVLDIDPEYAQAYIGKLCVDLKVHREAELIKRPTLTMSPNYLKALRFAQGDYLTQIQAYDRFSQDLFRKNMQVLEDIQKKIVKNTKEKPTISLKPDGTVVTTGLRTSTVSVEYHYKKRSSVDGFLYNESIMRDLIDGEYIGTLSKSESDGWTGGDRFGSDSIPNNHISREFNTSVWSDIIAIAAGDRHVVGLTKNNTVMAAGLNNSLEYYTEEIDKGTIHHKRKTEKKITGKYKGGGACATNQFANIIAVAAGSRHTVGLTKIGTVIACGRNEYKQCNTDEWRDIVMIAASDDYTLGIKADGTVVATGNYNPKIIQWKDLVTILPSGNVYLGIKTDETIVMIRQEIAVTGSSEQITSKLLEEEKKSREQDRIDRERQAEQDRIDQKRKAEQKRIAQEQEEKEREERERKNREREEQESKWVSQGLCKYCGGDLSFFKKHGGEKVLPWRKRGYHNCKTCDSIQENEDKGKKIKAFLLKVQILAALAAGAMIFHKHFVIFGIYFEPAILTSGLSLIPFSILLFIKYEEGWRTVIRVLSLLAQVIMTFYMFTAYGSYSYILLLVACLMAYKISIRESDFV